MTRDCSTCSKHIGNTSLVSPVNCYEDCNAYEKWTPNKLCLAEERIKQLEAEKKELITRLDERIKEIEKIDDIRSEEDFIRLDEEKDNLNTVKRFIQELERS